MKIRLMTSDDLSKIIDVHMVAFPGFFLTRMGTPFLRVYYGTVLKFPAAIALVAEEGTECVGFAVGFADPAAFQVFFRNQRMSLVWPIVLALLRNPFLLPAIWRNVRRVSGSPEPVGDVELASIASRSHGRGIGSAILRAFMAEVTRRGHHTVFLTTDRDDNEKVNQFYLQHGFTITGQVQRGTRYLNILTRVVAPEECIEATPVREQLTRNGEKE